MKKTILTSATKVDGAEAALLTQTLIPGKDFSLYFHVPFCTKKCGYCHFFVLPNHLENHQVLLKSFRLEWERRKSDLAGKTLKSIYFGGGTPSLLAPHMLQEILSWLPLTDGIEITLEANPENLSFELLQTLRTSGINRLSIGIQSLDDPLLQLLGRTHNSKQAVQAVHWAAKAGFENISIDLMYDLPHQTISDWQKTLEQAVMLPIQHLSLYNLTIEPQTLFFKRRQQLSPYLPAPEASLEMYQMSQALFSSHGFDQYEISAFAKDGFSSQHNVGYWTGRPFFGLGPSAFSFWDNVRFRNIPHLRRYLTALEEGLDPVDLYDPLPAEDRKKELLVVELRLKEGVCLASFQKRHGALDPQTYAALKRLKKNGLLQEIQNHLSLTSKGILFYDSIAEELI